MAGFMFRSDHRYYNTFALVGGTLALLGCPYDPEGMNDGSSSVSSTSTDTALTTGPASTSSPATTEADAPSTGAILPTTGETSAGDTSTGETSAGDTSTGDPDTGSSEGTTAAPIICGDGMLDGDEECDEAGPSATCDDDCTLAICGDGLHNPMADEECDDAGFSANCDDDCTLVECGDAVLNLAASEQCDPDGIGTDETCSPTCQNQRLVDVGHQHTCAVDLDGSLHCWGYGNWGELGQGNNVTLGDNQGELPTPPVPAGGKVVEMTNGTVTTCVRLDTGAVRCWGQGTSGALGYGNTEHLGDQPGELPVAGVALGVPALSVAVGPNHTCALLVGGTVKCWGDNAYGQLGYGDTTPRLAPDAEPAVGITNVKQLAVGGGFTCVLRNDGQVQCWGENSAGTIGIGKDWANTMNPANRGIGDTPDEMPPPAVPIGDPDDPVQQIACGYAHSCVLLTSGAVRCWGAFQNYKLGGNYNAHQGDTPGDLPTTNVNLGGPAIQVTAGQEHSCALLDTGKVRCWGQTVHHGYPEVDVAVYTPPGDVVLGGLVRRISAHLGRYTCATLVNDDVRCWGENDKGQLGYGHINSIGDDETPALAGPVPF